MIKVKRVYEPLARGDGKRFLVDRLWPRGIKKEKAGIDKWVKEVAPSDSLRKWFAHSPAKWDAFQKRYFKELEANPGAWQPLLKAARKDNVTLLFSAKDTTHNNAVALKNFLETRKEWDPDRSIRKR